MADLFWLQGGACSGNTMSFLNAEEPSACDLVIGVRHRCAMASLARS